MSENSFSQYVRILGRGRNAARSLDYEEALDAMSQILSGELEDVQLGAFLMLLRVKEESPEELAGFAQATRNYIRERQPSMTQAIADIDWPSYAGKRDGQALYILSMLLLSENKLSVLCHGSRGHTAGRLYTQDVFETLGLPLADTPEKAEALAREHSLVYLPLQNFCEPLERIMHLRNLFGLRSPVHSFAKLVNPGNCPSMIIPTFHPSYKPVHQAAAKILKTRNLAVFKGESGEAQRRPQAILSVDCLCDGIAKQEKWPALLEGKTPDKSPASLDKLIDIWRADNNDALTEQGIIGTTALALHTHSPDLSQEDSLAQAKEMWHTRNKNLI